MSNECKCAKEAMFINFILRNAAERITLEGFYDPTMTKQEVQNSIKNVKNSLKEAATSCRIDIGEVIGALDDAENTLKTGQEERTVSLLIEAKVIFNDLIRECAEGNGELHGRRYAAGLEAIQEL